MLVVRSGLAYNSTSIRLGPSLLNPSLSASAKHSNVVTRLPGTPIPFAKNTQSMSGVADLKQIPGTGPWIADPEVGKFTTLQHRVGAVVGKITVVTFKPSRAMVHSAWAVYMPLPSADRHKTRRSGHATAAPTARAHGNPNRTARGRQHSREAGASRGCRHHAPLPEVMDSSTTMAFSGRSAPTAAASPGKVISPTGIPGRSAFSVTICDPLKRQRCRQRLGSRASKIFAGARQCVYRFCTPPAM